jgi:hypothetical protein
MLDGIIDGSIAHSLRTTGNGLTSFAALIVHRPHETGETE